jgi:uncharacterized SAM-binding protein YcdF (DUF218 family)
MKKFIQPISTILIVSIIIYLSLAFVVGNRAEIDTKKRSDVILILGARSYIDKKYNPCLEARVAHAVDLYKQGYASKIIVSGGNDIEDNVNEAETMKEIAIEKGVKTSDVLMEKSATSTYENFLFSQEIITTNKLKSVIIVTEPFHMPRASLIADKLQYTYTISPTRESSCWQADKYFSKYFLKESLAILQYKLQNKL